jgi:hypothetical protein
VATFVFAHHVAQPGSPFLVVGGHTYVTHPPALTLDQRDHVSAESITIALGLVVLVGTIDLVLRLVRRSTTPGFAALSAGGILVLFSLFGLVRGLVGIGTAGLLVAVSGWAMSSTRTASAGIDVPATWYPDPTDRHDLRYWDGAAWGPHVATGGRATVDPAWHRQCR